MYIVISVFILIFTTKKEWNNVFILGYILDGFPSVLDDEDTVDQELHFIKHLPLKPDYIINLRVNLK